MLSPSNLLCPILCWHIVGPLWAFTIQPHAAVQDGSSNPRPRSPKYMRCHQTNQTPHKDTHTQHPTPGQEVAGSIRDLCDNFAPNTPHQNGLSALQDLKSVPIPMQNWICWHPTAWRFLANHSFRGLRPASPVEPEASRCSRPRNHLRPEVSTRYQTNQDLYNVSNKGVLPSSSRCFSKAALKYSCNWPQVRLQTPQSFATSQNVQNMLPLLTVLLCIVKHDPSGHPSWPWSSKHSWI